MRALAATLLLLTGLAGNAGAGPVTGTARVEDGDTLAVAGQRLHLHGIDAPEPRQTCRRPQITWACGDNARRALRRLVAGRTVTCQPVAGSTARCRAGGRDLGAALVLEGHALAVPDAGDAYELYQERARRARRGVWFGEMVPPWDWRKGKRLPEVRPAGEKATGETAAGKPGEPPEGCRIKGNIGADGERIYHLPGGPHYDRTEIDESAGERWFCSEREARRAGWRPAGR